MLHWLLLTVTSALMHARLCTSTKQNYSGVVFATGGVNSEFVNQYWHHKASYGILNHSNTRNDVTVDNQARADNSIFYW